MTTVTLPILAMHFKKVLVLPKQLLAFLTRRRLLVATYLSSLAYYFVRKAEQASCVTHPVVAQIVKIRKLLEQSRNIDDAALLSAKEILAIHSQTTKKSEADERNVALASKTDLYGMMKNQKSETLKVHKSVDDEVSLFSFL